MKQSDNRLMTAKEASKYIGVSVNTFRSLCQKGLIVGVRIIKRQYFTTGELDKWLKDVGKQAIQSINEKMETITSISRSACLTDRKCVFGKAQKLQTNSKQNNTPSSDLTNSSNEQSEEQKAS